MRNAGDAFPLQKGCLAHQRPGGEEEQALLGAPLQPGQDVGAEDGGAAPYEHGGTENAIATLSVAGTAAETLSEPSEPIPDYELLSEEDIEALF